MIYVDSCIPMYLVGAQHELKSRVIELLPDLISSREELVTSAEVFQEILHRYLAIKDRIHLHRCYEALEEMAAFVYEMRKDDTDKARNLSDEFRTLSSRDCLHLAIMKRVGCKKIWTYDVRFDEVSGLERVT